MPRGKLNRQGKRSKFEVRVAKELDDAGVKYEYETLQLEYQEPLRKNLAQCGECGSKFLLRTGRYTPDFVLPNGIIIEAKGKFDAADRRKMLAVRAGHPTRRIVFYFMRDNRIARRSNTYYSDWCMNNDYDFSIGQLKQEWLA